MKSMIVKRSILRDGHKSSVSLEDEFWTELRKIADRENMTVSALVGKIDQDGNSGNLSSAIRVFILNDFRTRSLADGQRPAHRPSDATGGSALTNV